MSGLPMDKSLFFAPYYQAIMEDEEYTPDRQNTSSDYKKELDSKSNRRGRARTRMSLDQFIAQSDGLGARTNLNQDIGNNG